MKQRRHAPRSARKSAATGGIGEAISSNAARLQDLGSGIGDAAHGAFHGLLGDSMDGLHDWVFGDDHADEQGQTMAGPTTSTTTEPPVDPGPSYAVDSADQGNDHFISQFATAWNPNGPNGSTNCGPASLAMMMSAKGTMPAGLTAEQRVDHARALMNPGHPGITWLGSLPILDRDKDLSTLEQATAGIASQGGGGARESGWSKLDTLLENEGVAMGYGFLDAAWREKFPERVGSGDIAHLNAILGKTSSGDYIVNDPMHTGGSVEMSREDLAEFFGGEPDFVAWK